MLRNPLLTDDEKRRLARAFYERELIADERTRILAPTLPGGIDVLAFWRGHRPKLEAELRKHSALGETALITWAADDIIQRESLNVEPGSAAYRELCHTLLRGWIEATKRSSERDQGQWGGEPDDPLVRRLASLHVTDPTSANPASPTPETKAPASSPSVTTLHKRYLGERKDLTEHTKRENHQYVTWFEQFIGAKDISQLTKKDVVAFKDALLNFPAQATKIFPGKTFSEMITLNEVRRAATLSNKTIAKYLSAVRTFLSWCVTNDVMEKNVAAQVNVSIADTEELRECYSIEQLNQLFTSPLYAGCLSAADNDLHLPGHHRSRDHRFWLPLLALFTGARLGEIAQLLTEDIKEADGIAYFDLCKTGKAEKRLKTKNAKRIVPVHDVLVRLGFLDYAAETKSAGHVRVFPAIKADTNGSLSSIYSKTYAKYLRRIGIKTSKAITFHSFRHTFITAMRLAGINDSTQKALVGHSDPSVTSGYGNFGLKVRHDATKAVRYDGLKIEHLYVTASPKTAAA